MENLTTQIQEKGQAHDTADFRLWLQQQFTARCKRNPRYSLRAFAGLLKMDPSSVSQIFSGKRHASTKVIGQACETLGAPPRLRQAFVKRAKEKFRQPQPEAQSAAHYELLAEDAFAIISDWYHFAILELFHVEGFQPKASYCARTLGLSTTEAQIAIDRLLRIGLLRLENGRLVRTNKLLTNFAPGLTSSAHRNLQRQILQMALNAIDEADPAEKDITCMTMAIDVEKIPDARKRIARFRRDLCSFLEDGRQSRVYQLAVQLYPVSKPV